MPGRALSIYRKPSPHDVFELPTLAESPEISPGSDFTAPPVTGPAQPANRAEKHLPLRVRMAPLDLYLTQNPHAIQSTYIYFAIPMLENRMV